METSQRLALTVPQAADALGFAEATVWKYIANGTIPSFKLEKSRRIPVDALQEWIHAQAEQALANECSVSATKPTKPGGRRRPVNDPATR